MPEGRGFLSIPPSREVCGTFHPRTSLFLLYPLVHCEALTASPLRFGSSFEVLSKAEQGERQTPFGRMLLNGLCPVCTTIGLSRSDPLVFTIGGTLFPAEPLNLSKSMPYYTTFSFFCQAPRLTPRLKAGECGGGDLFTVSKLSRRVEPLLDH